jgi:hypothetical protein
MLDFDRRRIDIGKSVKRRRYAGRFLVSVERMPESSYAYAVHSNGDCKVQTPPAGPTGSYH